MPTDGYEWNYTPVIKQWLSGTFTGNSAMFFNIFFSSYKPQFSLGVWDFSASQVDYRRVTGLCMAMYGICFWNMGNQWEY
jgi:hypothetical protein